MKKTITTLTLAIITLLGTSAFVANQTGIAGFTGSPGEATCNNPGCHSGGSSAASGITITASPDFTNNAYVPGETYEITINVAASGFSKYGFDCEILNSTNGNAGFIQNAGPGVKFLNSAGSRKNATHTTPKTGVGGTSFTFEWIAPDQDAATIYAAANAVNGNGNTTGDFPIAPVNLALTATPDDPTGIKENKAGVVSNIIVSPNPASGMSSVAYVLSKSQSVSIQLVDLNGKTVKEFAHATKAPGPQSQLLDLQNVAPGVYFVRTLLNEQKASQKLLVVQ